MTTSDRRSYTNLMNKPAMGLYDEDGRLVATIRADTPHEARDLFKRHGLSGARVRRVGTPAKRDREQIAAMEAHARLRRKD